MNSALPSGKPPLIAPRLNQPRWPISGRWLGLFAGLFFLVKGLLWLAVPALAAWAAL